MNESSKIKAIQILIVVYLIAFAFELAVNIIDTRCRQLKIENRNDT